MIPDSFIQELLGRVDICDVVERYVPLKKAGANFSACCPFHSEKTPSFTVSPSKQFYHCFGCGAHGTAIGFLMQHAGVGFIDAVEDLATSVGLKVPQEEWHAQAQEKRERVAPLTELMASAMNYYREQLKVSPSAVAYLKKRGLTGEIAAKFGLGYAPDGWQNLQQIFPDYNNPALVECGLVIVNEQGRRYDRFRDRVMFPIQDGRGNVIGFGGRVMGNDEPKYLNSPETPLFIKGSELYGLPQARRAIRDEDMVLVVEGYMDVVGLAQWGVENVVATLGTAATESNVQKLLKQASRVVFCFDRDAAGDRAAWRAMEVSLSFLADNKVVEILQMPGNQDPDEFIREHGKDAFVNHTRNATRLSEFLLRELSKQANTNTIEGRALLVHLAKPLLQKVSAPILRVQLTKEIAARAQISQAEVEAKCELKPLARWGAAPPRSARRPTARSVEYQLLKLLVRTPTLAARLPHGLIDKDLPEGAALQAIVDAVEHGLQLGNGLAMAMEYFRGSAHESVLSSMAEALLEADDDHSQDEAAFVATVSHLQGAAMNREISALVERARHGLNAEERTKLSELLAKKAAISAAAATATAGLGGSLV
ncbi:MAG: DNA primase [Rhodocyclaceae bacterium]|nr:DNA primase [Rhodocyclaceae bacterium]MBP6108773.1 DNA primase [Rhodocyclaceae bacterium]